MDGPRRQGYINGNKKNAPQGCIFFAASLAFGSCRPLTPQSETKKQVYCL